MHRMAKWNNPALWFQQSALPLRQRSLLPASLPTLQPAPTKIFVEGDGPIAQDYFEEEPGFKGRFYDLLNGFYGPQNYLELFYALPEIFAPIHEIASRVADANWQLCRMRDDEVIYTDEAFNRLFNTPNPLMSHRQMVYQSVVYEILTGKALWHINQANFLSESWDGILAWWPLPSQQVVINMQRGIDPYSATELEHFVQDYRVPIGNGKYRVFTPSEVMQSLHLDLSRGILNLNCTQPLIKGAEKAIRNLIPVYEARGTIYIKRGALGWWVNDGKDANGPFMLTDADKAEILANHQAESGITKGKNPLAYTNAHIRFERTAMSIQELQPFEETLADALAIYGVLRVPRHLVPSKEQSTFDNAEADMISFYQDTIIPWASRYAQIWEQRMGMRAARRWIRPSYTHLQILQENKKEKADADKVTGATWLERWKNGACTLNDWIVSFEGTPGVGPIYEKKIFELTPDEKDEVINTMQGKTQQAQKNEAMPKPAPAAQKRAWQEQPRVPAGNPEGGEWADGDTAALFAVGAPGAEPIAKPKDKINENPAHKIPEPVKEKPYSKATVYKYDRGRSADDTLPDDEAHIWMRASGVPKDFEGTVTVKRMSDGNISVHAKEPGFEMMREIHTEDGVIHNEYFRIADDSSYKGQGARIFAEQVREAETLGFDEIQTWAARSNIYNGYYTWARLGYEPREKAAVRDYVNTFNRTHGTDAKDLTDVMGTKTGQEWWKENGRTWNGKFDVREGSRSRKTLENYLNGKGR